MITVGGWSVSVIWLVFHIALLWIGIIAIGVLVWALFGDRR